MPIAETVVLGKRVTVFHESTVNLYGCVIGDDSRVGAFVEIQAGATIGARCKISSHSFVCEGVQIEDEVFVGHGVMFTNDRYPRATRPDGALAASGDWALLRTTVKKGASIGSNATILPGVTVGAFSIVAAAAAVVRDVPDYAIVAGVPAQVIGDVRNSAQPPT